jgi:hypothetical protein
MKLVISLLFLCQLGRYRFSIPDFFTTLLGVITMFRRAIALAGLSALLLPTVANAQFKDADGNIHIQNLTPGTKVEISSGELAKKITANFCGLVTISKPTVGAMPATLGVGTDTITVAGLPVQTIPRCVNGALAEARAANFQDATGRVVVVGKTPGTQYDVTYTGTPGVRSLTANLCGFVKISNSTTKPAPATFTYAGTPYTTANLPTQLPGRCLNGIKYLPQ